MKFTFDYQLQIDEQLIPSADAVARIEELRKTHPDIGQIEGRLSLVIDGAERADNFVDPIVKLLDTWLRKLPWIIGGDTETVALRNSEQCFAFVPAGDSVELTYFTGTEAEIEDYIIEPATIRLDHLITESIAAGERLVELLASMLGEEASKNEDYRDLTTSLSEAKRSWHEHQIHARR